MLALNKNGQKPIRVQWIPNLIKSENRLCLTRIRWEIGHVGFGGYSCKLSISIIWEPRDLWIGLFWDKKYYERTWYLCLISMYSYSIQAN